MFIQRDIEVTVVLSKGSFGGEGNTKIMRGLATAVNIEKVGLPDKNKASVGIYGLPISDMEEMTTLAFLPLETEKNLIEIKAGEADGEFSLVFSGEISSAFANFNQSPNVVFTIEALAGYFPALTAIPASTGKGSIAIIDLLNKLCGQAGYSLINEGVSGSCHCPYYVGSPIEQMKQVAEDNDFELIIDDNEVIALPLGVARKGNTVILSKDTGLIGYPTFTSDGISLVCVYEGSLKLGGLVKVESIVPKASGIWKITKLSHTLSANVTGENIWQSSIEGVQYD